MAALLTETAKAPPGPVRRIYENLGLLLGGKAAAGLISLIYVVVAARVLGPEQYGVLVLVNYFAMLIGGLIAFPKPVDDGRRIGFREGEPCTQQLRRPLFSPARRQCHRQ